MKECPFRLADIHLNVERNGHWAEYGTFSSKKADKIDGYSEKLLLLCTIKPIY